ncbi:MAG: hypothetical protein KDA54_06340 [Phycisphaerales bacterium]|nr:hypothetical protein [Phycisphaerales bacterium]
MVHSDFEWPVVSLRSVFKEKNGESNMAASKKTTYASVRANLQKKANFFKTLANQTTGPASSHRPSPSQLNSFSKWVEKGAVIQNVSQNQLNRWAGSASKSNTQKKNWSVASAKTTLAKQFGKSSIKAVAYNKSGGFIVATSPTRNGKNFRFPTR